VRTQKRPLTWDLKDGAWAVRVVDVKRVCGIIDNDGSILPSKGHQLFQLLPGSCRSGGVVRGAEEDQVRPGDLQQMPNQDISARSIVRDHSATSA
jgi:hypothetical protein